MPKKRSDTSKPQRRDPAATRRKLLTAARREFASSGLAGARVDEIAARAGVNKQLVYHYFGDKDALYLAVLEWVYEVLLLLSGLILVATELQSDVRSSERLWSKLERTSCWTDDDIRVVEEPVSVFSIQN